MSKKIEEAVYLLSSFNEIKLYLIHVFDLYVIFNIYNSIHEPIVMATF